MAKTQIQPTNAMTETTSAIEDEHSAAITAGSRRRRGLIRAVAAACISVVALPFLTASPASAAVNNYYGSQAYAYVGSSTETRAMTVKPVTTPMTGYDRGQAVIYRVAVRDVSYRTPGTWQTFAWQGPWTVTRSSSSACYSSEWDILGGGGCSYTTTDTSKTGLGSFTISGLKGHRYEVQVQLGYAVGNSYSVTGWFKAEDCFNTYVMQGVSNSSRGAACQT